MTSNQPVKRTPTPRTIDISPHFHLPADSLWCRLTLLLERLEPARISSAEERTNVSYLTFAVPVRLIFPAMILPCVKRQAVPLDVGNLLVLCLPDVGVLALLTLSGTQTADDTSPSSSSFRIRRERQLARPTGYSRYTPSCSWCADGRHDLAVTSALLGNGSRVGSPRTGVPQNLLQVVPWLCRFAGYCSEASAGCCPLLLYSSGSDQKPLFAIGTAINNQW